MTIRQSFNSSEGPSESHNITVLSFKEMGLERLNLCNFFVPCARLINSRSHQGPGKPSSSNGSFRFMDILRSNGKLNSSSSSIHPESINRNVFSYDLSIGWISTRNGYLFREISRILIEHNNSLTV